MSENDVPVMITQSEWMRRMKMMGYNENTTLEESYNKLGENDFTKVAGEMKPMHSKIYVVTPNERENLTLPKVYSNEKYSVFEVPSVEVADFNLVKNGSHELVAQSAKVGD